MLKKYFFLFVFSLSLYFAHAIITGQGLYGDGNGYYLYTNTLYFQQNLNFGPIYNYLENFHGKKYIFSRIFWHKEANPYSIGTGIFWLPSMSFISVVNFVFNLNLNRFDLIYELGPGITGILSVLFGLYFLEKYLLNFFSRKAVFWTILTIFFTSNVLYFTALEPALSHQPSFLIICFLLFWTYKFNLSKKNLFIFGLICGFLFMTRMVDTIMLIPILLQLKPKLKHLPPIGIGFFISVMPQLINQFLTYRSIFTNPYLTGANGIWQFNLIHLFEHLFSQKRGLFLWSPIFLLGFWGLIKSKSKIFIASIIILWLVSSSWSAFSSAGYGQRFSFCAIPLFSFGLAFLINRWKLKKILTVFLVFSFLNINLLSTFYLHKDKLVQDSNLSLHEFIDLQIKNPAQVLNYIKVAITNGRIVQ